MCWLRYRFVGLGSVSRLPGAPDCLYGHAAGAIILLKGIHPAEWEF